jgi:elongation factor G
VRCIIYLFLKIKDRIMPHYHPDAICNIAFTGHSGSGKTMLTEALLHHAGLINQRGSIAKGDTVCDYDPLEKEHLCSLNAALVSIDRDGRHINIIDTPGAPEFFGHALSVFPAVETIAVVINAQAGIEVMTRRMMERAKERNLCRALIINKIDGPNLDLPALMAQIKESFGSECLPLNLPADNGKRVVDCFFNPNGEADFSSVSAAHTQIIDQVVEVDENLMALYLEQGEELNPAQLHDPFEKAMREGHLVPILFTSAETGAGIDALLSVLARLMPNPFEGNPRPFLRGEGHDAVPFFAQPDESKHAIAHVFKVSADPFMGKLSVFRVHQGTITKDSQLFIGDARKPFKVGHLFKLQGKQQVEISKAIPGDLCAVAKVDAIFHDAVLHDSHDEDHIHLKPLRFPQPLYGLALQCKRGDEQKLHTALEKLIMEDPCLKVEHDASLNQTVLRGLGQLHLRVALERMKAQYNLDLSTETPKIPYRETINASAEGHYRHKKQSGGAGQFGEVFLRIKPLARGEGFVFKNEVVGGAIPAVFVSAVEKGVLHALENGAIAGYPMQDIEVTVYDGKTHSVDSKEIAFVTAGKKAFLDAVTKAKAQILEPIVKVEVSLPQEYMGTISGDLAVKRGRILGTDSLPNQRLLIKAEVPLAELGSYEAELKSMTGGHGAYTLELDHYEAVPASVQQQLSSAYKPKEEDA